MAILSRQMAVSSKPIAALPKPMAILSVKRRQGDVPWDAVHRTLKLQYQPRRKVYTDDAVIAEPV